MMIRKLNIFFGLLVISAIIALPANAKAEDANGMDFFESKIRPVLSEQCYSCHSGQAKRLRGGLRLDSRKAMLSGGDTGPALVAGQADKSLLIKAIQYQGLEMPPKGKLPESVIADFRKWVAMGAPAPEEGKGGNQKSVAMTIAEAKKHWAYQPIGQVPVPKIENHPAPIDAFITKKLNDSGLSLSPPADRRTLIRRLYLDVIGLPPTYEEVVAFEKDKSANAIEKVVDHLLASPHYGERWGRHWLDVARYADTKDLVLVFGKDRIRPYAYTYRDYVVRALNEDTPFNQFIVEQIAADHIQDKIAPWRLGAMGFLTLGRLFDNNPPDIIDDQIDTVTRGFLGLTVSCARCHDHKYDAIPTDDYYSLYGVFASSEVPTNLPLLQEIPDTKEVVEFEKRLKQKQQELERLIDTQYHEINQLVRMQTPEYLAEMVEPPGPLETSVFFLSLSPNDLRPQIVAAWRRFFAKQVNEDHRVFGPWQRLMNLSKEELAKKDEKSWNNWLSQADSMKKYNSLVTQHLLKHRPKTHKDVTQVYGTLLRDTFVEAKKANKLSGNQAETQELLDILVNENSPTFFPKSQTYLYMSRVPRGSYGGLLQQMDTMAVNSPHAPARGMVLVDAPTLHDPHVFIRGNPRQLGKSVPRRFLTVFGQKEFANGSGRLDLAKAIASNDNSLTPRVIVNRIWTWHFGQSLVTTPSDFGARSNPPSHPELLDWLAWTFVNEDGWSLKKLHRRILLSQTYQQSSFDREDCRQKDPENELYWRFSRRTLDLEAMRDSMLAVSGRLDRQLGGRPVDIAGDAKNIRRTIYGLVDRQDLPGLFRNFNFASPDQSADKRPQTIVPQQALFGMNSPFVMEQSTALARSCFQKSDNNLEQGIQTLYRKVLQRNPSDREVGLALQYLQNAETHNQLDPQVQLAQVLLLTNEFMTLE